MANLIGQILLNQFRVDAFIASGGMGSVYRVWDIRRNVTLAMKVLHSDLAEDPHMLKRFQREARALKKLSHPNIVPFYGMYEAGSLIFLLEQFIDGPNLKDLLHDRKGILELSDALAFLKPICAALGFAHSNGVVHCEVKPGNVMMDHSGQLFLTDFGIARHAESSNTTFSSAGTLGYMAPEQILGEPLTPASDVYALGIILFEMLIGRRPFKGDEASSTSAGNTNAERIRYGHLHLPPPHLHDLNSMIPIEIDFIIQKALEKTPEKRYKDAREFFTALAEVAGLLDVNIPEKPSFQQPELGSISFPSEHQLISPSKPSTPILFGVIGILVVLIVGAFWFTQPNRSTTSSRITPSQEIMVQEISSATPALPQTPFSNQISPSSTPVKIIPTEVSKIASKTPKPNNGQLYEPLANCAPSHLHIGDLARVSKDQNRLFIRSTADTHPSDNINNYVFSEDVVLIIDGPVCSYGWLLWKVSPPSDPEGWIVENDGKKFLLNYEKKSEPVSCQGNLQTRLMIDGKAQVSLNGISNKLRKIADTSGTIIDSIKAGTVMKIVEGPKCADGYTWWRVRAPNGISGWTAEGDDSGYFLNPYLK